MPFLTDTDLAPMNNQKTLLFGLTILVVLWALCRLADVCLGCVKERYSNLQATMPTSLVANTYDDRAGHDKYGTERFLSGKNVGPRFNGTNMAIQDYYAGEGVTSHSTGFSAEHMGATRNNVLSDAQLMGKAAGR